MEQLLILLKKENIKHFSVTDHDYYGSELNAFFLSQNLNYYKGIEISAKDYIANKKVHLLGYGFNENHSRLKEYSEYYFNIRKENSINIINNLVREGYKISSEDFNERYSNNLPVYKQHIMEILIKRGYTEHIYGKLYQDFKSQGIFKSIKYIDYKEAISLLKEINALIFLAHPGIYENWELIPELSSIGLDGIEAYNKRHNENDIFLSLEKAKEFNLLVSGGSDYHGEFDEVKGKMGVEIPNKDIKNFVKAYKML